MPEIDSLKKKAYKLRRDVVEMVYRARSGHPGGALGMADVLTVLYYKFLRDDPQNPKWPERDRFILSNGHTCPILYAILADRGYFSRQELWRLRRLGALLQGHPSTVSGTPGVEFSSGSTPMIRSVGPSIWEPFRSRIAMRLSSLYWWAVKAASQVCPSWHSASLMEQKTL